MKCLYPGTKWVVSKEGKISYLVPCGKCVVCLEERKKEWCIRLVSEYKTFKGYVKFLTLTYSDENLNFVGDKATLEERDVQLFLKRFRKNTRSRLKYYYCGEYGEKTYRPHYHMILYIDSLDHLEEIESCWGKGHVRVDMCNIKTIRYVLGYIDKSNGSKNYADRYNLSRPYQRVSKGLGKDYLYQYVDILKKGYIVLRGHKYRLPRYWLKKDEKLKEEVLKKAQEYYETKCSRKPEPLEEYFYFHNFSHLNIDSSERQKERNYIAKTKRIVRDFSKGKIDELSKPQGAVAR